MKFTPTPEQIKAAIKAVTTGKSKVLDPAARAAVVAGLERKLKTRKKK